jgi:hypothetical protein
MNIFVLHENPVIAAQMHCDRHCCKMIIEHNQMLAASYYHTIGISRKKEFPENQDKINDLFKGWPRKHPDGSEFHYSVSHVNHPCTIWARTSIENFNWLLDCTESLCDEFLFRYKHEHSGRAIVNWMRQNPPNISSSKLTPFAQAMPDCYKSEDSIEAYRKYYGYKPSYMDMKWAHSEKPEWFTDELINESSRVYQEFQLLSVA